MHPIVQNKLNKGKLCKTCFNDQKTAANNKQTVGNLGKEKINSNTDNEIKRPSIILKK